MTWCFRFAALVIEALRLLRIDLAGVKEFVASLPFSHATTVPVACCYDDYDFHSERAETEHSITVGTTNANALLDSF